MSFTGMQLARMAKSDFGMFTRRGGRLLSERLVRFNESLAFLEARVDQSEITPSQARKKLAGRIRSLVGSYARLRSNPPKYAEEVMDTDVREQFFGTLKDLVASSAIFDTKNEAHEQVDDAKDRHDVF